MDETDDFGIYADEPADDFVRDRHRAIIICISAAIATVATAIAARLLGWL